MRKLRLIKLWLTIGFALVGLVILLSLIPLPFEGPSIPSGDKIWHLGAYFLMMLWFGLIYLPGKRYKRLGLALIAMGVILELVQGMTGERSLEYLDMLANAVGVIMGWLVARTRLADALVYVEGRM